MLELINHVYVKNACIYGYLSTYRIVNVSVCACPQGSPYGAVGVILVPSRRWGKELLACNVKFLSGFYFGS